jgi:hypothetical protein
MPGGAIVTWVSDDGAFVRVAGSMTGMPVSEVAILQPRAEPATVTCSACGFGYPEHEVVADEDGEVMCLECRLGD